MWRNITFRTVSVFCIIILLCAFCATSSGRDRNKSSGHYRRRYVPKKFYVTYTTDPLGATISAQDGSGQYGFAPTRVQYIWDRKFVVNGCLMIRGVKAQWISGATAQSPSTIALCQGARDYTFPLSRPKNAKDLKQDMEFALKVQKMRMAQEKAEFDMMIKILQVFPP